MILHDHRTINDIFFPATKNLHHTRSVLLCQGELEKTWMGGKILQDAHAATS